MNTISLCMIVKNEELTLSRCLTSIKNFVDEIIIVDTGSTDNTKQLAKQFTNKIYDYDWEDDFSKARNFAFSKANCKYIMWLDADDVVPKSTLQYLIKNKQQLNADVYMLKYDIAFKNNKPTFSYFRERIIKNCKNAIWQGVVHECITPFGIVEKINKSIHHKKLKQSSKTRNLNIYKNLKKSRPLSAREQYYYARELFDHKKYTPCIKELTSFLKRNDAWVENKIDACFVLAKCYNQLNDEDKMFDALLLSFKHDTPRANFCCFLGDYHLKHKNFEVATYWFLQATKCKDITHKGGFVEKFYYNYYPYLQLCVCYYNLGDFEKANNYNEKAGKIFESDIVKHNRKFFKISKKP